MTLDYGKSCQPPGAPILGASGISGWALLNQIHISPAPTTFDRTIGTTNRRYSLDDFQIPRNPLIRLVSGVYFSKSVDEVIELLQEKVEGVEIVSLVYFTAYIHTDDFESLRNINTDLLETAIRAIGRVSSNLQHIVLPTGGKGYGVEFSDKISIKALV
jgi:hypothetical protein